MNSQENTSSPVDQEALMVAEYLSDNPDFFCVNQHLLTQIRIPHESGKAISLVERQLGLYREKCRNLEAHLNELVQVARENEKLNKKVHGFTCRIISCYSVQELDHLLRVTLREQFNIGWMSLHFLDSQVAADEQPNGYQAGELKLVRESMDENDILCGRLTEVQKSGLFGGDSDSVESAALIWLKGEKEWGLMALGSEYPEHFSADKGQVFLQQLRDIVSHKIDSFLRQ